MTVTASLDRCPLQSVRGSTFPALETHCVPVTDAATSASAGSRPAEALCLALIITAAASAIPGWNDVVYMWRHNVAGLGNFQWPTIRHALQLALALVLVLPTWRRSGLHFGSVRGQWRRVVVVCGLPPLATLIVYPISPRRVIHDPLITGWLISPAAQEMIFLGYIYGMLRPHFADYVHPKVPIERALILTTLLFGLWHLPNLGQWPVWLVAVQFVYTGILSIVPALSRQWTGSIIYVIVSHSLVNFIPWVLA